MAGFVLVNHARGLLPEMVVVCFLHWVGGLPGWLAGGWWYSRREVTEVELFDKKSRELCNGRLAM
jgi:hypothetical protein